MKQFDVVSLGESLIDFLVVDTGDPAQINLEGHAGGATANVVAALAKLGRSTSFITKVGQDAFGAFIQKNVAATGVDTSAMVFGEQPTTLAMVALDATGNRSFSFYRDRTADVMLQKSEVDEQLVTGCRIFHFGSVNMPTEPSRGTTLYAAQLAKGAGVKISFDPNYRPALWKNKADAVAAMDTGAQLADYMKVSDEEALLLTGEENPEKAGHLLVEKYGLAFVAVTLGPKGSVGVSPKACLRLPAYDLPCVDTTGAGDAFWGAALFRLLALGDADLNEENLADILRYGNASGSIATTKFGAVPGLSGEEAILHCIQTAKPLV